MDLNVSSFFPYINIIDKQYINMQLFNNGIREEGLTYKALAIISKPSSLSSAITLTLSDIHGSTLHTSAHIQCLKTIQRLRVTLWS